MSILKPSFPQLSWGKASPASQPQAFFVNMCGIFSGQMWAKYTNPRHVWPHQQFLNIRHWFCPHRFRDFKILTKPSPQSLSCYGKKRLSPLPKDNLQSQEIHKRKGSTTSCSKFKKSLGQQKHQAPQVLTTFMPSFAEACKNETIRYHCHKE